MPLPINPLMQSIFGATPASGPYVGDYSHSDRPGDFRPAPSWLARMAPIASAVGNFFWQDPMIRPVPGAAVPPAPAPAPGPAPGPMPADPAGEASSASYQSPTGPAIGPFRNYTTPDAAGPSAPVAGPPALEVPPKLEAKAKPVPYVHGFPGETVESQAEWRKWFETKNDDAYSAPGGYHPRPDILELRGDQPHWTSTYGVGVPSNDVLRRYNAGREQVGFQKQKADAETSLAATEAAKADNQKRQLDYELSDEGKAAILQREGLRAGNQPLTDAAVKAGTPPSPFESLGPLGMATRPELLPGDFDELVAQYAGSGGPELELGGELGQALRGRYGPIVDARAAGRPFSILERFGWNAPPRPQIFRRPGLRSMVGPPAPVRTPVVLPAPTPEQQQREDDKRAAMRMF